MRSCDSIGRRTLRRGLGKPALAMLLALAVACGSASTDDSTHASETVGSAGPLPVQAASWIVSFTSFEEMVATTDAVVVTTVTGPIETQTYDEPGPDDYEETIVRLRVDDQIYGSRSVPEVIRFVTSTHMYGEAASQGLPPDRRGEVGRWPEWRTPGKRVVVFFGWYPESERVVAHKKGWERLNGHQSIYILDGEDLEATFPADELAVEVASWSFEEFRERLDEAVAEKEAGRVTPQPDRRKNPPSPQIDEELSGQASPPPPGPDEEPGARP